MRLAGWRSRGEHHVTWRCGECEGLVLDLGPEAGHPVDAEPGHRAHCERLAGEVSRYVNDEIPAGLAALVTDHVREFEAWNRPEVEGPGLELW